MNPMKCKNCGLTNFPGEMYCRRCTGPLWAGAPLKKEKRPRRFSIISLAIYTALAFGGYQLYQGAMTSIREVNNNDAYRVGVRPVQRAQSPGLSRMEQDRRRASQFSNDLKDNPSFQAKRKQEEETQKAIKQASSGGQ